MSNFFLCLVSFGLALQLVSGLECYQCTSRNDTGCGEKDLMKQHLKPCDSTARQQWPHADPSLKDQEFTICRKQEQEINGKTRYIRGCGIVKSPDGCYQTANPPTKTKVCSCSTDGCNPAAVDRLSSILTQSTLFVFLLGSITGAWLTL